MKVEELIKLLKKMPKDVEVLTEAGDYLEKIGKVEHQNLPNQNYVIIYNKN